MAFVDQLGGGGGLLLYSVPITEGPLLEVPPYVFIFAIAACPRVW